MAFGTVDGEDDDFLDQQQPADQGDAVGISDGDDDFLHQQPGQGEDFMSDDEDYRSAQGEDDFMSDDDEEDFDEFMSDDDDDDDDGDFDEQPDQGDLFTALLTGAIRIHVSDEEDVDEEEEEYAAFPMPAPPAAASKAAIAALEAAEAPADDCCPVCLQDAGEATEPADARPWSRVAPCGHRFHAACVDKWLRVKLTCPACRCCPAAPAGECLRDAAPEPPRPFPDIVDEMLAMGYDESRVFEKNPRWMEFMADDPRNSSGVPLAGAA